MIEVRNLTKRYGSIAAIEDVSFTVQRNEILGFLGPNGAGKSTTMRILTGALSATSGSVKIDGHDVFEAPIEAKKRIGYLPEHPPLYGDQTVRQYLSYVCALKGVAANTRRGEVDRVMGKTGIADVADRLVGNISKGYRQRVGLAQALCGDPPVLILDEPTVGLDPQQWNSIRDLVKELAAAHTVVLSSHYLEEVSKICNRVVVITRGHIVAEESIDKLTAGAARRVLLTVRDATSAVGDKLREIAGITHVAGGIAPGAWTIESSLAAPDPREQIAKVIVGNDFGLLELRPVSRSLEDVFLELTAKPGAAASSAATTSSAA